VAPDVIVLDEGDAAALSQDPQWMAVPAVRTGRVFRLPTGVFIWNRPRSNRSAAADLAVLQGVSRAVARHVHG